LPEVCPVEFQVRILYFDTCHDGTLSGEVTLPIRLQLRHLNRACSSSSLNDSCNSDDSIERKCKSAIKPACERLGQRLSADPADPADEFSPPIQSAAPVTRVPSRDAGLPADGDSPQLGRPQLGPPPTCGLQRPAAASGCVLGWS